MSVPVPPPRSGAPSTSTPSLPFGHHVCFYDDPYPVDIVSEHLSRAFEHGGAGVAIATSEHLSALRGALDAMVPDTARHVEAGRLLLLDAHATLEELIVDGGGLSEATFQSSIGARIEGLASASAPARAFDEMGDVLCRDGRFAAAIQLEGFWNRLRHTAQFDLLCGYGLARFDVASAHAAFSLVCDEHTNVRVSGVSDAGGLDNQRLLAELEQRRRALSTEVERRELAEEERARRASAERFLAEAARLLSSSLDYEETIQRVAQLAVPSFADWCIVDLVTEEGDAFARVGVGHHRPDGAEVSAALRRKYVLRADISEGVARALADRTLQVRRDIDEETILKIAYDEQHLRALRSLHIRSWVIAPLVARGRAIGALTLIACERNFEERDIGLAEQLASSSAAAIDNARLFAAEQRARMRVGRMQEVTAALSRARTAAEVADTACRIGAEAMDAFSGALWVLRDDGALVLTGSWGKPESSMDQLRVIHPSTKNLPALEVARTGVPVWVETAEDYASAAPEMFEQARRADHVSAYGIVSLSLDGRIAGVIAFGHPIGHRYDETERAFYIALGQHVSHALDRARLLDAERRSNERLRLLAAAGETLAQSLDLDQTLRTVARLTVPAFSDWCIIDLVEGEEIRRVASQHQDPERMLLAEQFAKAYPVRRGDGSVVAQVVQTGESRFQSRIQRSALMAAARDAEEAVHLVNAGLVSGIVVPLLAQRERIGVLSFTTAESGRIFDEGDLHFAQELGRRAGLAIQNARLYRAAHDALRRAEEANRIKDEFLATVSHELRTPLNAIAGWSALLTQKMDDPVSVARGLEVIHRNAQAQTKIIEDILDVSRIVTGKLKIDPRPVDMIAVVRDALEVVRASADAKQLTLTFEAAPDTACLLVGDASRLQQVVWNLLSNAIKFTSCGGSVTIAVEQKGPSVHVTVTDTGRGIEPDFLPYVFDRFRQADSSTTRKFGGLGLGLAIVRHIVELHGGRVSAESAGLGKGATFRVALPVRAIVAQPSPDDQAPTLKARPFPPGAANLRGTLILVVDDERDARELVEAVLVGAGAVVKTASSAREGIEALARFRPEVIVSDIGMPGEDGYAFIRQVRSRAIHDCGAVAAVALTAYARSEDRIRAVSSGYSTHVTKPVDPGELIAVIAGMRRFSRF